VLFPLATKVTIYPLTWFNIMEGFNYQFNMAVDKRNVMSTNVIFCDDKRNYLFQNTEYSRITGTFCF
jgi:hypothetical protein